MTDGPDDADWRSELADDADDADDAETADTGAADDRETATPGTDGEADRDGEGGSPAWAVEDAADPSDADWRSAEAGEESAGGGDDGGPGLRGRFARADWRRWLGGHLLLAVALFFAAAVAGWELLDAFTLEQLQALAEEFGAGTGTGGDFLPELTTATIFLNNARVAFIAALGAVTGGLTSAFVLLLNGFIVGAVVNAGAKATSVVGVLALIVPHGVLELPAFWVVSAVGFRVTHRFGRYLWGADDRPLTRQEAFEAAVVFVAMVALLLVAAAVEVHLTPRVGEAVGVETALG